MKKKFKNYLLLLFFIALTLNIPSVMAKQYTEGWIRRTGPDAAGNQMQIVDLENIFTYDKNGKKIEKLLIDCSGLKEAGFGYGNGGYTDKTDKINYGLCKIAEYDTNLPTVSDTMVHTLQEGVSKTTIEIIDANGNHYDEYYNNDIATPCDAILTAETKNTKGYECRTLSFGYNGKTLPLGKYTIRKTYIYTGGSTSTPVTKTLESTFEVAESSNIESKGFIISAYDSGTNKLIRDYPIFFTYELFKNVDDTEPISDCWNSKRKCYTFMEGCPYEADNTVCSPTHQVERVESNKMNAKGINPAPLTKIVNHNAKKICLRAMVNDLKFTQREDGTWDSNISEVMEKRTREQSVWFCLKYVDEFGSDYRFEILDSNTDGRNADANRVKAIGKKKIQDFPETYEQEKNLGGMVSTISYSTFQINIPYTGNGSNNGDSGTGDNSGNGGNSGTDSDNQGNNTSSNAGTINIEFSNIKDSVKGLEYKLCTTKDCSEQVIFSSTDVEASISNLKFDKKYYLVISKVPSNYAMPQDNVKEITLTKDNTSFSVVFKLSEKANVPNTLANRPMIIVLISILALAGGGYLIYRSMKSQKLN